MATDVSKDKLVADLKVLVSDTEELLRATASAAGEKAAAARERMQSSLAAAKAKLAEAEHALVDRTKQAAQVTDEYVHEHPWPAVAVGTGIGFLLGLLIGRR